MNARAPAQDSVFGGVPMMERFRRMTPPFFKGESDPILAESWLRETEKIFRALRCAEEERVSLATYMLQERADVWWSSILRTQFEDGAMEVAWTEFVRLFKAKYIPEHGDRGLRLECSPWLETKQSWQSTSLKTMATRGRRGAGPARGDESASDQQIPAQQAQDLAGVPLPPPPPPVDYGALMQGLVHAMQTQAQTTAALQAQVQV
ncbi:hypothetical protein Taro_021659 [Colocasia esculenta]|uniref:Retrotransposon gag domain-containing protein n=1 Tax=Colocasia esculenta TaxID=4460 RepID=A0A843UZM4_COLES|nr:hypothetical protein [Colocasia esculenta]